MRAIWTIAMLHLRLHLQNRTTYIQSFIVPFFLMLVLALAIQDGETRVRLDVVDQDQSEDSAQLIAALEADAATTGTVVICVYGAADLSDFCGLETEEAFAEVGEERVGSGVAAAAVVIPAGFGEALAAGQPTEVLYQSNEQLNAPTVTRTAVQTALNKLGAGLTIASQGAAAAEEYFGTAPDDTADLRERAQTALQVTYATVKPASTGEEVVIGFGANQSVPGMASMYVMFSLLSLSATLVIERQQGTLQRLFTVPTTRFNVVMGKIFGAYIFGLVQFTIFVVAGTFLGTEWGQNYPAIFIMIMAYCLTGTALGFALATLVRTPDQAGGMITLIGLTLAPLGGAWWPLEIVPEAMQRIGHLSPIAWVMGGFKDVIYYNRGVIEVLPEAGVLLGMAALLITFAVWRFRYE